MDGSGVTVTFGLVAITSATISPTWLFMSVTPHMLDAVLLDLNGLSTAVVIAQAPSGRPGRDRSGCRRSGSWRRPSRLRTGPAYLRAVTPTACGFGWPR